MSSHFSSAKNIAVVSGLVLAAGVFAFRANADEWDKKTILTVNQPIQISDTYLDPGTYVLKLDRSSSNRNIVRIFNERENHLYNTVMAIPNYRIRPTGNSRFMFYETPAGTARALRAWFYPGDNFGQEFPYPKHLREIAVATPAPAPPAPPAPAPQVVEPETTPAPAVTETQPQVQEETQVEIAQNTPPPAPAPPPEETTPPPAPQVNEQPQALPQTASPFALIGLTGLLSLGVYGLLRVKQTS